MKTSIITLLVSTALPLTALAFPTPARPFTNGHQQRNASTHPQETDQAQDQTPGCDTGQYLTGDWGGWRCRLKQEGLDITGDYTSDTMFNVSGGKSRGGAYADSWGINFDFDLAKLIGLANTHFYVSLVDRNGADLSVDRVGNQFSLQQIYGNETFTVNNVYFKYNFGGQYDFFKIGRVNAADDFQQADMYYDFVSNAIDGNPIGVFYSITNFSAYPNAQWGALLQAEPVNHIVGKIAVYNTNNNSNETKYHGLNWSFRNDNGALVMTEWDFINGNQNDALPAKYGIGAMYVTGNQQISYNSGEHVWGDYGFYYQIYQMLYRPNGPGTKQGLGGFLAMQFFPNDRNEMPFFGDAGLKYTGIIPQRPDDFIGIAYAYGRYSPDLAKQQNEAGVPAQNFEGMVELTYRIQVKPWLYVQPDLQYIIKPKGTGDIDNALAIGAQVGITF